MDPQLLISLVLWILISVANAYFANLRGRDPYFWFLMGVLFGALALIVLFFLPDLSKQKQDQTSSTTIIEEAAPLIDTPEKIDHSYLVKDWFYLDDSANQHGPMRFEELKSLWMEDKIQATTFVWSEGMEKWLRIEEMNELHGALIA